MKNPIRKLFLNEHFILYLVIINAFVIFIQEFENRIGILDYVEPIFTLLFVVEFYIKATERGFKHYIDKGWNRFDFILLLISLPSLLVLVYPDLRFNTNAFLALRTLRVFKFLRVLKFMPNMKGFILSFKNALKASYIVLFGFAVLLFIISLLNCALFKGVAPEYFSNPLNALYSTFRVFSVEGWYEIPDLIAERSSAFMAALTKVYFVLLLLCGGMIGMSLVNSIFVDAMVSDNNDELLRKVDHLSEQIEQLKSQLTDPK